MRDADIAWVSLSVALWTAFRVYAYVAELGVHNPRAVLGYTDRDVPAPNKAVVAEYLKALIKTNVLSHYTTQGPIQSAVVHVITGPAVGSIDCLQAASAKLQQTLLSCAFLRGFSYSSIKADLCSRSGLDHGRQHNSGSGFCRHFI